MTIRLAKRVHRIKPSPTLAVTARAARLKAEGKDIIGLGAGEPDFDTPLHIQDAGIAAIRGGHTRYTAVEGTSELPDIPLLARAAKKADVLMPGTATRLPARSLSLCAGLPSRTMTAGPNASAPAQNAAIS